MEKLFGRASGQADHNKLPCPQNHPPSSERPRVKARKTKIKTGRKAQAGGGMVAMKQKQQRHHAHHPRNHVATTIQIIPQRKNHKMQQA